MKQMTTLIFALFVCFFVSSCDKDDENGGGAGSPVTLAIDSENVKMYIDEPVYSSDLKHLMFGLYNGKSLYDSDMFITYNGPFNLKSTTYDFADASILFIGEKQFANQSGTATMTKNDVDNQTVEFTYDCVFFNTNQRSETVTLKGSVRVKYIIE